MAYLGDFRRGVTLDFKFTTNDGTGAPTTLSGTPAISVYLANGTTQSTAGVTLSVDFDTVTGLNNVNIVTTDAFYVPGDYQVVITTGTVDSISVVGYVVAEFSLENRFVGEVQQATAQSGAAQAIQLVSGSSAVDDFYNGDYLLIVSGTGAGQFRQITDYVGSTTTATVDRAWATQPDSTSVYRRFPGSLGNTVAEIQSGLATTTLIGTPVDTDVVTDIANIVELVFARAFEATKMSGYTFEEITGFIASAVLGKSSGVAAGSPVYRNLGDSANAVSATASDGDRSAVALTAASVR